MGKQTHHVFRTNMKKCFGDSMDVYKYVCGRGHFLQKLTSWNTLLIGSLHFFGGGGGGGGANILLRRSFSAKATKAS